MPLSEVRGVCLDLGGTVVEPAAGSATGQLAELVGVELAAMREFLQGEHKRRRSSPRRLAAAVAGRFGTADRVDELTAAVERLRAETAVERLRPGAEETLRELRARGYALAFLSNVLGAIAPERPGGLGRLADVVLLSCDTGQVKPERAAFAEVERALDLPAGQLLHVGDSLGADVLGARAAGWHAVHLDGQRADADRVEPAHGGWWRITELSALTEILPGAPARSRPPAPAAGPVCGSVAARGWFTGARVDPITGLVAFPDLQDELPRRLAGAAAAGDRVGVAIGDVDDLKSYVEGVNSTVASSFGHLAGNAVMTELGAVARDWFVAQPAADGCVSTFGGDEVIVVSRTPSAEAFHAAVTDLRDRLRARLPRSVSFSSTVLDGEQLAGVVDTTDAQQLYVHVLTSLDRRLFEWKARSRRLGRELDGFVVPVDLTASAAPSRADAG